MLYGGSVFLLAFIILALLDVARRARESGYEAGRAAGLKDGYDTGRADGLAEGQKQGRLEGLRAAAMRPRIGETRPS